MPKLSGSMRYWMVILMAIMLVFTVIAFSACGAEEEDAPAPPVPEEPSDEDEDEDEDAADDRMGGTLTIAFHRVIDVAEIHRSRWNRFVNAQIYTPLVWEPSFGEFVPGLAEDWDIDDDYMGITLYLRDDIDLTDGTHMTADVLVASWERGEEIWPMQWVRVADFSAAGEYEFRVDFENPEPNPLGYLTDVAGYWTAPQSPSAIEEKGDDYSLYPVSYGPFKIDEWTSETELRLVRNEDYNPDHFPHIEGPFVDTLICQMLEEESTRTAALRAGEVDMVMQPAYHELPTLTQTFNQLSYQFPGVVQVFTPNLDRFPTSELAVRQAMLYGLDREAVSQIAFFGAEPGAYSMFSEGNWAHNPDAEDRWGYDPERAVSILEEAGWEMGDDGVRYKDGEPLEIRFIGSDNEAYQVALSQWEDIGFKTSLESMPYDEQVARVNRNDYEVYRVGLSGADPHTPVFGILHSSEVAHEHEGDRWNRSSVRDPELDELIEYANSLPTIEERIPVYHEIEELALENAYIIPHWQGTYYWLMDPAVQGFRMGIQGNPYFFEVWLDR